MLLFITRQLSFFSERIRGVKQWQVNNLSRVATQWHGWELNPQPSSYKAELFPLSHGARRRLAVPCSDSTINFFTSITDSVCFCLFHFSSYCLTNVVVVLHCQRLLVFFCHSRRRQLSRALPSCHRNHCILEDLHELQIAGDLRRWACILRSSKRFFLFWETSASRHFLCILI